MERVGEGDGNSRAKILIQIIECFKRQEKEIEIGRDRERQTRRQTEGQTIRTDRQTQTSGQSETHKRTNR